MRILLLMPASDMVGLNRFAMLEPLGLQTIAAHIPQHDVKILDLRVEPRLTETLASFQPTLVGVHCVSVADTPVVLRVATEVKAANSATVTVVGGHHPSLFPRHFENAVVDVVVIGDGEESFKELTDAYASGADVGNIPGTAQRSDGALRINATRSLPRSLDHSLLPNRKLTARYSEKYHFLFDRPIATLPTSKGCPYKCSFCSIWPYNKGHYRWMGAGRVVKELADIRAGTVFLADDNFLENSDRAADIAEAIQKEGIGKQYIVEARSDAIVRNRGLVEAWRGVGLSSVGVGLEYIQDVSLADVNKRSDTRNNSEAIEILHQNGIRITGLFIVNPNFDEGDFDQLLEYAIKNIDFPFFAVLTPLPGTVLHKERRGELLTRNPTFYNLLHAVLPTRLPRQRFYERFAQLYREAWLASIKRGKRTFGGDIDPELGSNIVAAFKQLSDAATYLKREEQEAVLR